MNHNNNHTAQTNTSNNQNQCEKSLMNNNNNKECVSSPSSAPSYSSSSTNTTTNPNSRSKDNHHSSSLLRQETGRILAKISDTINDNLILARYTTLMSLSALTVYGLSISPLFFRYKRITDIPISYFHQRSTLACRFVRIVHPRTTGSTYTPSSSQDTITETLTKSGKRFIYNHMVSFHFFHICSIFEFHH